ncbi:MAG: MBL fold metallo-hydrolase [Ilumatobacteraceae bacterium]
MNTTVDEIAPDIFRLSTLIPEAAPGGLAFNQFVVRDDQPFLFHTGMRQLYPLVSEAVSRVVPLTDLRWISFGHVEADECGAMNLFLADAPDATVVHGPIACAVSLNDLADRPPRVIGDDEVLDLGHHRLRFLPTPHVPHGWESGLWFDETTATLFTGDLFTHVGDGPAVTDDDIVLPALDTEAIFHSTSAGPDLLPTLERLAELEPTTLALMHGSSFRGDGATQLRSLRAGYAAIAADTLC